MEPKVPASPKNNLQILRETLTAFQHFSGGIADDIRKSARSGTLKIGLPLEVYDFFPKEDADKGAPEPEFIGWRYLLLDGEEVFGTAELSYSRKTKEVLFSKFDSGFLGRAIVRGVGFVEDRPEFSDQLDKMRLLRIPAYDTAGLWIPCEDDLIVPLSIHGNPIWAFSVFKLEELLAQLRK
jgi:hypothetical protein